LIKKYRPEEPQSFRDLALAYSRKGSKEDYENAILLLQHVIEGEWDVRFHQVEVPCLMDLNKLIFLMNQKGYAFQSEQKTSIDKRFARLLDCDLRIVINWDFDLTNVVLEVEEPNGDVSSPLRNLTRMGGIQSKDMTGGYGPVEYCIKKANVGKFNLRTQLYSPKKPAQYGGNVTVSVKVYTNFGREDEVESIKFVTLTTPKTKINLGSIIFEEL